MSQDQKYFTTDRPSQEDEISLLDILTFLKDAWKLIGISGLVGLVVSGAYLIITPNQYKAIANIYMAQLYLEAANIEESPAFINRISSSLSLNSKILQACALDGDVNMHLQLDKVIKLSIPKGVLHVVELTVTRSSPELAKVCASSIYDMIMQSSINKKQTRIGKVEERLAQDKAILTKTELARGIVTQTYFAVLTEIRNLEDERERLIAIDLMSMDVQGTKIRPPIFVLDKPVYPKKMISLLSGLMAGLFLGLIIAFGRSLFTKLKSLAGGTS